MSPYRPEPTVPRRGSLWVPFGLLVAMAIPLSVVWVLTPMWVPSTFNGGHGRVVTEGVYFAGLMFAGGAVFMGDHGDYGGYGPSYFKQAPYRALLIFTWWPVVVIGFGVLLIGGWLFAFVRWFRNGGFRREQESMIDVDKRDDSVCACDCGRHGGKSCTPCRNGEHIACNFGCHATEPTEPTRATGPKEPKESIEPRWGVLRTRHGKSAWLTVETRWEGTQAEAEEKVQDGFSDDEKASYEALRIPDSEKT